MRRAALLFAASLLASCSADLKEGHFTCGPAGECPSGWFCRADNHCYSTAGDLDAGARDAGLPFDAGPDYDAGPRPDAGGPPPTDAGSDAGSDAGCVPPLALCGDACLDSRTDPDHCGMRCEVCSGTSTPSCIGGRCVACTMPSECDDGLTCTDDACSMGACSHTPNATGCLIAGACVGSGPRSGNPCQACNPVVSRTGWSNLGAGASCDDGIADTCDDACNGAGTCIGRRPSCDDTIDCTTDVVACGAPGNCSHSNSPAGTFCRDSTGDMGRYRCSGTGNCIDLHNCCTAAAVCAGGDSNAVCRSLGCCTDCTTNVCLSWTG